VQRKALLLPDRPQPGAERLGVLGGQWDSWGSEPAGKIVTG
jgi:hypothetical protein